MSGYPRSFRYDAEIPWFLDQELTFAPIIDAAIAKFVETNDSAVLEALDRDTLFLLLLRVEAAAHFINQLYTSPWENGSKEPSPVDETDRIARCRAFAARSPFPVPSGTVGEFIQKLLTTWWYEKGAAFWTETTYSEFVLCPEQFPQFAFVMARREFEKAEEEIREALEQDALLGRGQK